MTGLDRSWNLLELLEEELRPAPDTEPSPLIESVVVNYMLTVIYSDLERRARDVVKDHSTDGLEPRLLSFVDVAVKRILRSFKCTELAGVLGMFDENCKRHFQEKVNDTAAQAAYDRIVSGRHDQAHALGSDMTLSDLRRDLTHCEAILEALAEAMACACDH